MTMDNVIDSCGEGIKNKYLKTNINFIVPEKQQMMLNKVIKEV